MMLKNNQKKAGYIGRLLVLPLAAVLFFFFSAKAGTFTENANYSPAIQDTIIQGKDIVSVSIEKNMVTITFRDGKQKVISRSDMHHVTIENDQQEVAPPGMDKLFTKVEVEAEFPGGHNSWSKYIQRAISENLKEFKDGDFGTCILKFVVDTKGNVSNVQATTMRGTLLAQVAINAVMKGPKWIPAQQNGHYVNAYRLLPVTLTKP